MPEEYRFSWKKMTETQRSPYTPTGELFQQRFNQFDSKRNVMASAHNSISHQEGTDNAYQSLIDLFAANDAFVRSAKSR